VVPGSTIFDLETLDWYHYIIIPPCYCG